MADSKTLFDLGQLGDAGFDMPAAMSGPLPAALSTPQYRNSLRSSMFSPQPDQQPGMDPGAQYALDTEGGAFERGLRSSGIGAFKVAPTALYGLVSGDEGALKYARAQQERAAAISPPISSYHQIKDIPTAAEYIAGKTGEIAPYLAAGLVGSPAVGAATFGAMGAGQEVAQHITPEGELDAPAGRIAAGALGAGAVQGALAAVPFSRVLKGAVEGPVSGALTHAATMGAVSPVMTLGSQAAESFINPNRDKSQDTDQLIESAIGGAASMLGPGFVSGRIAQFGKGLSPASKAVIKAISDRLPGKTDQGETDPAKLQDALNQAEQNAKNETNPEVARAWQNIASGIRDKLDSLVSTAKEGFQGTLDKGQEAIDQFKKDGNVRSYLDKILSGGDDPLAEKMKTDAEFLRTWAAEGTPDELRDKRNEARARASGYLPIMAQDPEAPKNPTLDDVAAWLEKQAATKQGGFFKDIRDDIRNISAGFKAGRKPPEEGEEPTKKSAMEVDRTALEDFVWNHMKPELRNNPEALDTVQRVARLFGNILSDDPNMDQADMLKLGIYKMADQIFDDPEGLFDKLGLAAGRRRAVEDAKDPNSVLRMSIDPIADEHMSNKDYKMLGEVLDRYLTRDLMTFDLTKQEADAQRTRFMNNLSGIFGSEEAVRRVLDHYTDRYKKDYGGQEAFKSTYKLPDEDMPHSTEEEQGIGTKEAPEADYVFEDKGKGRGFKDRMDAISRLNELRSSPQAGGFADGTNFELQTMLDYAKQTNQDPRALAMKLKKDYDSRIAEGLKPSHEKELSPDGRTTRGAQARALKAFLKDHYDLEKPEDFLEQHHVIKAEPGEGNDLAATNADLQRMRTGLEIKESTDPHIKEMQRAARFDVVFADGRKETFDAESVWKAWINKLERQGERSSNDPGWKSRALAEGLASIMARSDVVALRRLTGETVIDKALGTRLKDLGVFEGTPDMKKYGLQGEQVLKGLMKDRKGIEAMYAKIKDKTPDQIKNALNVALGHSLENRLGKEKGRKVHALVADREALDKARGEIAKGMIRGMDKDTFKELMKEYTDLAKTSTGAARIREMFWRAREGDLGSFDPEIDLRAKEYERGIRPGADLDEEEFSAMPEPRASGVKDIQDELIPAEERKARNTPRYIDEETKLPLHPSGRENYVGKTAPSPGKPSELTGPAKPVPYMGKPRTGTEANPVRKARRAIPEVSESKEHPTPSGVSKREAYQMSQKASVTGTTAGLKKAEPNTKEVLNPKAEDIQKGAAVPGRQDVSLSTVAGEGKSIKEQLGLKPLEENIRDAKETGAGETKNLGLGKDTKIKDMSNPIEGSKNIDPTKASMERPSGGMTDADRDAIKADFVRMFGDSVKVEFKKEFGWSGDWDSAKNTATISTLASNARSVGWHEALHAFISQLTKGPTERKMRESLLRAAESGHVRIQLEKLLQGHPEALEQIRTNREERLAYMFQFYHAGALKVGPETRNIFGRMLDFIRKITGAVASYEKAEKYMDAIYEGKFAEPSEAAKVIEELKLRTLTEKLEEMAGPLGKWSRILLSAKSERLKDTGIDAFREIANLYYKDVGEESGGLGQLQASFQKRGIFINRYQDIVGHMGKVQLAAVLKDMRTAERLGRDPTSFEGKQLRKLLDDMHKYLVDSGVKRTEKDPTKGFIIEHELGKRPFYFPRVYDLDNIRRDKDGFVADMMKDNNLTKKEAEKAWEGITKSGGTELNDSDRMPGHTPFMASANVRKLAKVDDRWLSQDLHHIMSTYIMQAAHRGEYAKVFGNTGRKLEVLLEKAKEQGATPEELKMAVNAIKGYEGTMRPEMSPFWRKVQGQIMVYENLAVLPFALFGSMTDPLGQLIRGGDWQDVRRAYAEGIKGVAKDLLRIKEKDGKDYEMSRTLGIIDQTNMMEAYGELASGMYMGKYMRKINEAFFRWNGLDGWTRRMRATATVAAERFILKHAENVDPKNSERYLRELGISKADVKRLPDDRLAYTQEHGLSEDQETRIQQAIFKWVDGAVVRPNSAHRPIWGSDPHYMLIFHLKQFGFSQHAIINKRVGHEWEHGNYMPALALLAYAPMMEASDLAQDIIAGHGVASGMTGLYRAIARSGMAGKGQFGLDALMDPAYGNIPGQSLLGPAGNHLIMAAQTAMGMKSGKQLLTRSLPAGQLLAHRLGG